MFDKNQDKQVKKPVNKNDNKKYTQNKNQNQKEKAPQFFNNKKENNIDEFDKQVKVEPLPERISKKKEDKLEKPQFTGKVQVGKEYSKNNDKFVEQVIKTPEEEEIEKPNFVAQGGKFVDIKAENDVSFYLISLALS